MKILWHFTVITWIGEWYEKASGKIIGHLFWKDWIFIYIVYVVPGLREKMISTNFLSNSLSKDTKDTIINFVSPIDTEMHSESGGIFKMELFVKMVSRWKPFTIFAEISVLNVWLCSDTLLIRISSFTEKIFSVKLHFCVVW